MGLQAALSKAQSRIEALEDQDKALQEAAVQQQTRETKLVEEANMLRRAVQVLTISAFNYKTKSLCRTDFRPLS